MPKTQTIRDLMRLAEQAIANGDYGSAEELAIRAQTLAALRPKMGKGGIAGVAVEYTPEMIEATIANIRKLRGRVAVAANPCGKSVKIRNKAVSE